VRITLKHTDTLLAFNNLFHGCEKPELLYQHFNELTIILEIIDSEGAERKKKQERRK